MTSVPLSVLVFIRTKNAMSNNKNRRYEGIFVTKIPGDKKHAIWKLGNITAMFNSLLKALFNIN